MKFGENLKAIRKSKKMSQEQLAEKLNVSRQSVSKWETGDAFPEMNHILELCKLFSCKINDLVHTDMSDISSLDEEIIMRVVKFNEEKQKKVRTLSNVIGLIGKIGRIVLLVAIPFVVITMLLVPYVVNHVEITENVIGFTTDNIQLLGNHKLVIFDVVVAGFEGVSTSEVITMFQQHSTFEIIGYLEAGLVFLIADLVIMIFVLNYVEKLFDNIKNHMTPFTLDNVNYIKKIAYYMIALILISPISSVIFNLLLPISEAESTFELMNILEILIIFSMSYIFEYGYEIQKDSQGIMYEEENTL